MGALALVLADGPTSRSFLAPFLPSLYLPADKAHAGNAEQSNRNIPYSKSNALRHCCLSPIWRAGLVRATSLQGCSGEFKDARLHKRIQRRRLSLEYGHATRHCGRVPKHSSTKAPTLHATKVEMYPVLLLSLTSKVSPDASISGACCTDFYYDGSSRRAAPAQGSNTEFFGPVPAAIGLGNGGTGSDPQGREFVSRASWQG